MSPFGGLRRAPEGFLDAEAIRAVHFAVRGTRSIHHGNAIRPSRVADTGEVSDVQVS